MLQTLKKFFDFCGEDNRRMFIASIWLGVVSAICSAMRIPAAAIVIQALLERDVTNVILVEVIAPVVVRPPVLLGKTDKERHGFRGHAPGGHGLPQGLPGVQEKRSKLLGLGIPVPGASYQ